MARVEPGRIPALDGLRGVGAGLVFLVHYASTMGPWIGDPLTAWVFGAAGRLGNRGVDLLFVLSGFLIYGSLMRRPQRWGTYLRRRAARLYPAFLAVLGLYLLAEMAVPSGRFPTGILGGSAYILANVALLPGLFPITPIITVAWTLSYEAAFYLLVPVLPGVLQMRQWPRSARVGAVLLAAVAVQAAGAPFERAAMFAGGMLVVEAAPWLPRWGPALSLAALAGAPASAVLMLHGDGGPAFWVAFATLSALCGSAVAGGAMARALSVPPLRWLGTVSYSFYLLHGAVLHAVAAALNWLHADGDLAWVLLAPAFVLSLGAAAVMFRAVEQPFLPGLRPGAKPGASPPYSPNPLRRLLRRAFP